MPTVDRIIDTVRPDARGRRGERRAAPVVAVVGTGRMGSAMARALARDGHRRWSSTTGRRDRATRWPPSSGARGRRDARGGRRDRGRRADDARRRRRGRGGVRGPDGLLAGAPPGTVLVDLSTVIAVTIRALERRCAGTGAGILDAPGLRQRRDRRERPADADGRRRRRRTWSGRGRPSSRSPRRSSTSARWAPAPR